MDHFSEEHFHNDDAARAYLEGLRWPDGPICPHCGVINRAYAKKRGGVYRCAETACRKDFSVTMNSPMERSHIKLHKWVQAIHLMCSSKKGVSAHQLHRTLDITYRSAWFMAHRIRECMRDGGLAPLGGGGGIVEVDETYFGNVPESKRVKSAQRGNRPFTKGGRVGVGGKRALAVTRKAFSLGIGYPFRTRGQIVINNRHHMLNAVRSIPNESIIKLHARLVLRGQNSGCVQVG